MCIVKVKEWFTKAKEWIKTTTTKLYETAKSIVKWVGTDGLLHFLVCYGMILTFNPIIGFWWSLLTTTLASLGKEIFDYFIQKDNDKQAVRHDLIMDGIGIVCAFVTLLIWLL